MGSLCCLLLGEMLGSLEAQSINFVNAVDECVNQCSKCRLCEHYIWILNCLLCTHTKTYVLEDCLVCRVIATFTAVVPNAVAL